MRRAIWGIGLAVCLWIGIQAGAQAEKAAKPAWRTVILTTDCGTDMDDQWAVAHLALSPEIDLRGIVTTHAFFLPKPEAEFTARTVREALAQMPIKKQPPVFAGSSDALKEKTQPLPNAGVEFLLTESRKFSARRRLTVLVIGAATDVASALITDPTLGDRIEIVAMGFNSWPEGGDEWNIKNDPKAWQILLESRAPITVGDQAVCKRDLAMTRERAQALFAQRGAPGRYLADLFIGWLDKHPDLTKTGVWPVWDEVTVAHLLGLTKSETHPRPTLDDKMRFIFTTQTEGRPRIITWITSLDTGRFWDDFTRKLDRALADHAAH